MAPTIQQIDGEWLFPDGRRIPVLAGGDGEEPPAPAAPPEPSPWEPWGQVFQDPTAVNPHELHQHHQWVSDLRSDDMHGPTLERALRDWGYLQEGEGLSDFQKALEAHRQASADPFAAMRGAGGDDLGDLGDEEPYLPDPQQMRQIWQQDIASEREKLMSEFENRQASARLELELERQLDRVVADKGLDPDDKADLWNQVQYRLQTGQVNPQGLSSLVADTYGAFEARVMKAMNARMSQPDPTLEPPAPAPGSGGGGAPTPSAPATTLKGLARKSMERLAQMDAE